MRISDWSSDVCSSDLHQPCSGCHELVGLEPRPNGRSQLRYQLVLSRLRSMGNIPSHTRRCGAILVLLVYLEQLSHQNDAKKNSQRPEERRGGKKSDSK